MTQSQSWKENLTLYLVVVGAMAWLVPGGGHYLLEEKRRAAIIFVAILATFVIGLYVGSLGVIDPVHAKPWYVAQVMNSPAVMFLGSHVASVHRRAQQEAIEGRPITTMPYHVYGRPGEIGQIYTSIAGLLNLLCVVNAVYLAHKQTVQEAEA
jgi:hypothetical protein